MKFNFAPGLLADEIEKRLDSPIALAEFMTENGIAVAGALRTAAVPEGVAINAAKIIGWARDVIAVSRGDPWTETELKLAHAIMSIANGELPQDESSSK